MARGNDDVRVETDYDISELEREAEQNGDVLEWNFDQDNNDFEYTCRKMTPEEDEDYLAWEQEE
jgi:hypothetical protein